MIQLSLAFVTLTLAFVQASPILNKRIAQTTIDAVTPWENACDQAGGGLQCNPLAVTAAATLLAAAGPCDQQNAADQFVDLAKKLGSQQMLSLAQIFTQQPRNTPNSLFVPYCQQAPANPELNGLFQCQYVGANPSTFVGGVAVGGPGTIPFGKTNPLSPPGSCPANPGGPIAAGSQLVDITKNPNAPGGDGGLSSATANSHGAADGGSSSQTVKATAAAGPSAATGIGSKPTVVAAVAAIPTSAATSSSPPAGFQFTNAKDAQVLNAGFANLTPTSACTAGENACVQGQFAQCVGGKYVIEGCAASLTCAAVPLVNSAGTSIICDTPSDITQRFKNAGATGSLPS